MSRYVDSGEGKREGRGGAGGGACNKKLFFCSMEHGTAVALSGRFILFCVLLSLISLI